MLAGGRGTGLQCPWWGLLMLSIASPISESEQEQALRDGGGACVRCGCTIFGFCRQKTEGGSGIFLLCPDCLRSLDASGAHPDVLRRIVAAPLARQASFDRRQFLFPTANEIPDVVFPDGTRMAGTFCPIVFGGHPVLTFAPQSIKDWPLALSLILGTVDTPPQMIVDRNHWRPDGDSWTFARTGTRYAFRHADGDARLVFTFPTRGQLVIEELFSWSKGNALAIDGSGSRLNGKPVTIPPAGKQLIGVYL